MCTSKTLRTGFKNGLYPDKLITSLCFPTVALKDSHLLAELHGSIQVTYIPAVLGGKTTLYLHSEPSFQQRWGHRRNLFLSLKFCYNPAVLTFHLPSVAVFVLPGQIWVTVKESPGLQILKYFLSCPLHKRFANLGLMGSRQMLGCSETDMTSKSPS